MRTRLLRIGLITVFAIVFLYPVKANVVLPRIFSSNMVLQQGFDNPIWGWASPGECITVTFNGNRLETITSEEGEWQIRIPTSEYGGPYTMEIAGMNRIVLDNVMIGEVWICSGQSNMEFQIKVSNNSTIEIANAGYPNIRLFQVPQNISQYPLKDVESGEWMVCSPVTVQDFSAVGYYFGRELYKELHVAVGLIQSVWGATVAETWTSAQTIENDPDFRDDLVKLREMDEESFMNAKIRPNTYPTLLFNGMINPLIPYAIQGVIWYQGESNASRAKQYKRIFPNLIKDWRNRWSQGNFPFLFVQLANFREACSEPGESKWAELREAQTTALEYPNVGMAVAIDIGDAKEIHPRNKQEVGRRLALNAFRIAYGFEIVCSGPVYQSLEIKDSLAYIIFNNVGSGLMVNDKYGYLKGFTMAGQDHVFHWARAYIIESIKSR